MFKKLTVSYDNLAIVVGEKLLTNMRYWDAKLEDLNKERWIMNRSKTQLTINNAKRKVEENRQQMHYTTKSREQVNYMK